MVTLANRLYDSAYVEYSTPDFFCFTLLHTNDPLYDRQWNLINTGQNGGVAGIDIKAEEAWSFMQKTIGVTCSPIKVAVIDDGVEDHEDFVLPNDNSVVLDGYTPGLINNFGKPKSNHKHGECCAGIISALHNDLGLAGIASGSRIVPFRIFKNKKIDNLSCVTFRASLIAKTIKKAWDDFQCPIISNSWSYSEVNDKITDAINHVANQGRNGKGCIVVFSSGNEGFDTVSYPSLLEHVLSIGSMNNRGFKPDGSNYGDKLDLVAPTIVVTTDRMGDLGYGNNQTLEPNYHTTFYGTSASCPHVSGVAALMLSVRPELTRKQVFDILESTAQKVGNYEYNNNYPNGTWDEYVGYGLVDAHMAVVEATLYGREVQLLGDNSMDLCDESVYTCSIYHPDNFYFEWSTSSNLAVVYVTGNTVKIMPLSAGDAFVQVDVYSEGRLVRSLRKAITITDNSQLSLVPLGTLPFSVTTNTTWSNNNHFLPINVTVEDGATLTITGTVYCSQYAKIIVKPGGRLIVNGGKLTNSCKENMWQGIEVWGNSSTHQHDVNGSFGQGYIELKNGAVIENAKCAVELWRPGYYSTTGGIIHATDATFRNNAKAVHALWYANDDGGREGDYNGFFRNCTFTVDDDYIGTETFHKHVDLSHVSGIDFWGCDFYAKRQVSDVSAYCMGIAAYEACFRVDSYCNNPNTMPCPESDVVHSSFTGFHRGIHASNDGSSTRTFSVKNSVFNNNTIGLYALNTGYGVIVDNDFIVGCGWDCSFGIYADGVTGFCIEDNGFRPNMTNTGAPYGIVVINSNGTNDIYHNDFKDLLCGNVAVGDNTSEPASPNGPVPGLTYTCNTNTDNHIDFCVLKDGNTGSIAEHQGSAAQPAGNTFGGSQYHFYNDGVPTITYHYDINETDQTPSLLYRVGTSDTQSSNSCLSHYSGGVVPKSTLEKAALASDYISALSTYSSLRQLYESRIDGGNTPTQVADINNATPSDMWNLRAQLLGLSPFVSGEVLTTAADRYDVFTDPVLFEILAANPDELKKDTIICYLENKDHPLPGYMTDLLRQIALGFTTRTALLSQMAQYHHNYSIAAGDIVRSCLNDSLLDHTELRTWLGNMGDIASDRMIVASYLHEGDSVHAFALANILPELYGLHGDALADHTDYLRLIDLYQTLNREGRNVFELSDSEIAMVNGIASTGTGTSKTMADAILMERSDENISSFDCPTMPGNDGGNRGIGGLEAFAMNEALGFAVRVNPNPATTWATVEYTLPTDKSQAIFTVTNTLGVKVMSTELNGKQGQKVLDLHGLADGVYVYSVRCGELINTGKLMITK